MPELIETGYLALPSTEDRAPAVMVLPAWWGLSSFFRQLCDRLAHAGFVAFAPDVYDGKVAETIPQAEALLNGLDRKKTSERLHSELAALRQHPRTNGQPVGIIGFSMGAAYALLLLEAIPDQIDAVILFYGAGGTNYPTLQTPVLGHFAENDAYEDAAYIREMEQALKTAGANVTFHTYPGTGHWFFEANQPGAYNADAAELAWQRTVEFLKEHL